MARIRPSRFFWPFLMGLGLAYFVTGFGDRPRPISLDREGDAPAQTAVVESPSVLVMEKNVLKLGSPLSLVASPATGNGTVEGEGTDMVTGTVAPPPEPVEPQFLPAEKDATNLPSGNTTNQ